MTRLPYCCIIVANGVRSNCSLFGASPAALWSLEYADVPKSFARCRLSMPAYFRNSRYSGMPPFLLSLHSLYFWTHVSLVSIHAAPTGSLLLDDHVKLHRRMRLKPRIVCGCGPA